MEENIIMKKFYNLFAFLFVIGMLAAGFVSCSNPSGSGSASNEAAETNNFCLACLSAV